MRKIKNQILFLIAFISFQPLLVLSPTKATIILAVVGVITNKSYYCKYI